MGDSAISKREIITRLNQRSFHQTITVVLLFLFSITTFITMGECGQDSTKQKKGMVFKEPVENLFYYKQDNTDAVLWDSFMLVKRANAGEAPAQHELGIRYLTGQNFFADTQKAVYWIRKASEQDLVSARYNYGILLNNGMGVEWNPFEAFRQIKFAAEHKMPEAQYVFGLLHTDNLVVARNYSEAYRWLKLAADSGYAPASEILKEFQKRGIATADGEIQADKSKTDPDASSSRRDTTYSTMMPVYINFSSDTVSPPEDEILLKEALLEHFSNSGDNKDSLVAKMLDKPLDSETKQAILDEAEIGSPEALTLMARWYETGSELSANEFLASVYYLRAIRCNARWAPMLLWKLTRSDGYFERLRDAVNSGYAPAKYIWAELLASGFDAQLTERLALQFLDEADQQEYYEATVELGMCYYNGKWVQHDKNKGESLLRRAANAGNHEAQLRLWMIELRSLQPGTRSSLVDSLHRASFRGSVNAQAMLGYCYQKGAGVPENTAQAVYYYRQAAERGSESAYSALKEMYAAIRPGEKVFQVRE